MATDAEGLSRAAPGTAGRDHAASRHADACKRDRARYDAARVRSGGFRGRTMGRGRSSGVEHNLAKVGVEGSNPFARSNEKLQKTAIPGGFFMPGRWHGLTPGNANKARTDMKL
jgi:hypothetical protein